MVDNEKIIAARVAARIEEPTDFPDCNYESFCSNHSGAAHIDRKWREFEIENASTFKKIGLAEHHTQKIHKDIKNMLERPPFNGERGFWQDDRAVCGGIENYPDQILDRLAPVFAAFDSLDPNHQVRGNFEFITNEFKSQAIKIRDQLPSGRGMYKKRLKAFIPIGEKYLRDCFDITGKLIKSPFQSKPW